MDDLCPSALVISRFQSAVAAADEAGDESAIYRISNLLEHELISLEPFIALKDSFLMNGDGVPQPTDGICGKWAVSRLRDKLSADQIVRRAKHEIQQDKITLIEVSRLLGVTVNAPISLMDRVSILPNTQLPRSIWQEHVFSDSLGRNVPTNDAALVFEFDLTPVIFKSLTGEDNQKAYKRARELSSARMEYRFLLLRAMTLASARSVELLAQFSTGKDQHILATTSQLTWIGDKHFFPPTPFDLTQVQPLITKIRNFPSMASLGLAIDRLRRSRLNLNLADKAIDLGIALEVALMHGEDRRNQEISHKVGIRAGWLIGKTVEERLEAMRVAKGIYDLRSKAVHQGKAPQYNFEELEGFTRQILLRILERGKFPEWSSLTMGGEN